MSESQFDKGLLEITKEMIEVAFEFVHFNEHDIQAVYFFGSMRDDDFFNNFFYKVKSEIIAGINVNRYTSQQYDLSNERSQTLFQFGSIALKKLKQHFLVDNRQVPSLIRLIYDVNNKSMDMKFEYELKDYNLHETHVAQIFMDWMEEAKREV